MADNYLSFNYKNSSYTGTAPFNKYRLYEDFGGFIINELDDLTLFNPSEFSHEFVNPQFGNQSFFIGTSRENREFEFPIALEEISLADYRGFLAWLDPASEGVLSFPYNTSYGYDVKVNSITEGKFTVVSGTTDKYNVELTVGFITKNDWAARWITTNPVYYLLGIGTNVLIDNEDNYDFIDDLAIGGTYYYSPTDVTTGYSATYNISDSYSRWTNITNEVDTSDEASFYNVGDTIRVYDTVSTYTYYEVCYSKKNIINNHSIDNYYKISWNLTGTINMTLELGSSSYIITSNTGTLYTRYGLAIDNSNEFILITGLEPYYIAGGNSDTLEFTLTGYESNSTADYIKIEPISREII